MLFGSIKKYISSRKNNGEFSVFRFLSSTFICSALNTSLISCVIIPYSKSIGMLPLQISVIITIKRVVCLVSNTFFGAIFDRFGAKVLFVIGRALKLACYIVLMKYQSFYAICLSMVVYGFAEGTIQGKVSSFIYNGLKANDKLSFFSRAISLYYLVIDCHLAFMNFLAGILIKNAGYDIVIKVSIIMNIVSLFLIFALIPSSKSYNLNQFISKSFKEVFLTMFGVIKKNHLVAYLIALYGVLAFFAWQFGSIASMVLLDMGLDGSKVAIMGSIVKLCVVFGTLLSFFFFKNHFSLKIVSYFILSLVSFGFFSSLLYNIYLFCIFMMLVDVFYVMLEISLERNLEDMSDKKVRGTAISLAMTCCNAVATFANLFVGLIAQYFNYRISLVCVMVSMLVIAYILFRKIKFFSIEDEGK